MLIFTPQTGFNVQHTKKNGEKKKSMPLHISFLFFFFHIGTHNPLKGGLWLDEMQHALTTSGSCGFTLGSTLQRSTPTCRCAPGTQRGHTARKTPATLSFSSLKKKKKNWTWDILFICLLLFFFKSHLRGAMQINLSDRWNPASNACKSALGEIKYSPQEHISLSALRHRLYERLRWQHACAASNRRYLN